MDILGLLPKAPEVAKYLLVVIEYFTKWIEARRLCEILTSEVEKFTWKHLICKDGLLYTIITDNDTQFKALAYEEIMARLGVKHLVMSVEHPHTNGQVETTNRVILKALRTRLNKSKGLWN